METPEKIEVKEAEKTSYHPAVLPLAWAGAVFLALLVVALIGAMFVHVQPRMQVNLARGVEFKQMGGPQERDFRGGPGGMGIRQSNEQVLTGVVTAVGSDSITIAGEGATNTITTNSSTTYFNGTKPVVNDTVVVSGTTNNNTFTATEIQVR